DAPYPTVQANPRTHDPGPPPRTQALTAEADARVRQSVVRVFGSACNTDASGSGWVSARHSVVTAAHVVAGQRQIRVEDYDGYIHPATLVRFDPALDVAMLDVPSLTAPWLEEAKATPKDIGAVYGHPGAGGLRAAVAMFGSHGKWPVSDIY